MSLTPCRFFAQGNCRFGNNCRYYHGQPTGGATTTTFFGNRTLAPATFQPQQQQQQQQGALSMTPNKTSHNLDIIMETVKKDMQEWQQSGIWPYSCYGPIGGKPCVPGFEDFSPEEYRYNYMLHGGNIPPQIPQHFQQMCQLRINYQQTHSQENRITLERIATAISSPGAPQQQQQGQAASIFGGGIAANQQNSSSAFGGGTIATTQQQAVTSAGSIFGGGGGGGGGMFASQQHQQPGSSMFGGSSSAFGSTGTTSLFGSAPAPNTVAPVAGLFQPATTQQSIFGKPTAFGQPAITTAPVVSTVGGGGLFQQPQQQSIFGSPQQQTAPQPIVTTTTPGGIFQQPPVPAPGGSVFQQQPGGLFQLPPAQQQQQQQPGLFSSGGGGSIFGGGQAQQAPLQQQSQFGVPPPVSTAAPSIFGGPSGNSPLMQGTTVTSVPATTALNMATMLQQKGVFTEESELTPEELEAFKADHFTLENIPTRPPPQSLCL